jgi:hypothetical protein
MRKAFRLLLPLLLVAALAAACGGDDGDVEAGASDPDTPVSSLAGTADPGADPTWTRIEPTDDLVDSTVATPDELVPDPDDPNAVLVRFYGGVQECFGARATAVETPDRVTVTFELGNQPDAGDQACIEIAEAQELVVTLNAPVAERELVAAP